MKSLFAFISLFLLWTGCTTYCNEDLRLGQMVQIPIDLQNYPEEDAQSLYTWIINEGDTTEQPLRDILWAQNFDNPRITDESPDGYYSSNLHGSDIYFFQYDESSNKVLRDSITDIIILKSQEKIDDPCYKGHPNVQIDELSFVHEGRTKGRNDIIIIR